MGKTHVISTSGFNTQEEENLLNEDIVRDKKAPEGKNMDSKEKQYKYGLVW